MVAIPSKDELSSRGAEGPSSYTPPIIEDLGKVSKTTFGDHGSIPEDTGTMYAKFGGGGIYRIRL